jgi:hypothetical protein
MTAAETTAADFVLYHTGEIATATALLISDSATLTFGSIASKLERASSCTTRAGLVRASREALSWAVRRLPETDAAEMVLWTLRAVLDTPEAAKIPA